jgi:cobalt-zinc-cadmium efflux system membrane fusion protein
LNFPRHYVEKLAQRAFSLSRRQLMLAGAAAVLLGAGVVVYASSHHAPAGNTDLSSQTRRATNRYRPTEQEWSNLFVAQVSQRSFHPEQTTEGKIALNDDQATPIFSPYSGRVTRLLVKPGDTVEKGQPLFVIEATDAVQSLNDLMTATSAKNKAASQLALIETVLKRNRDLYEAKAVPLRDLQKAENDYTAAQNDIRAAEAALQAAQNRVLLLGRTGDQIAKFQETGKIEADTIVVAPLAGTVVQRKVGPGQYLNAGASDPVFIVGDLSKVWLSTYVRETDAYSIHVGQPLDFTVTALPGRSFSATIDYVASALETNSRRLLVRATVENPDGALKPEMFASVNIFTDADTNAVAVPRESIVQDGRTTRVWVVRDDRTIELRRVKTGLSSGSMIQVLEGLAAGDSIVVRGSLFLDRVNTAS